MKKVYVAGKYNALTDGARLRNTNKAIDMGIRIYTEKEFTGDRNNEGYKKSFS